MQRIEHIGIAVKTSTRPRPSMKPYWAPLHTKKKWHQKNNYLLFQSRTKKIELLASTSEDGVIAKYIEKRGEGIHHIAFHVDDIYAEMQRLRRGWVHPLQDQPKKGADGKLVCFVHPKGTNGVLVELCMDDDVR